MPGLGKQLRQVGLLPQGSGERSVFKATPPKIGSAKLALFVHGVMMA
jgi:hypothetical protein